MHLEHADLAVREHFAGVGIDDPQHRAGRRTPCRSRADRLPKRSWSLIVQRVTAPANSSSAIVREDRKAVATLELRRHLRVERCGAEADAVDPLKTDAGRFVLRATSIAAGTSDTTCGLNRCTSSAQRCTSKRSNSAVVLPASVCASRKYSPPMCTRAVHKMGVSLRSFSSADGPADRDPTPRTTQ